MEEVTKESLTQVYLLVILNHLFYGVDGLEFVGKFYALDDAEEEMLRRMNQDREVYKHRVYSIIPSYER